MTDELTPEQEATVRRLLAEARHDGPMPVDVAARLDAVLTGLGTGLGQDDPRPAPVTDLAGMRRRRRNGGRLLLAAAAVVIGGVTVGQVLGSNGISSDDSGDADSASGGSALSEQPRDGVDAPEAAGADEGSRTDASNAPLPAAQQSLLDQLDVPVQLTSDNFAADVQRQLRRTAKARRVAANADLDGLRAYQAVSGTTAGAFVCPDAAYGEGARLPAYYDAEESVLVLRRPRAGIQRVDLLACGTAVQLNSVELPAP